MFFLNLWHFYVVVNFNVKIKENVILYIAIILINKLFSTRAGTTSDSSKSGKI